MFDTLVLGDSLSFTGGPIYLGDEFDTGDPQVITDIVRSLFLDGSVVTGDAFDNRPVQIPLLVVATNRLELAQITESIAIEANKPTNSLTWTPYGGFPLVFDVFRMQMTTGKDRRLAAKQFTRQIVLTCSARPFARSPQEKFPAKAGAVDVLESFSVAKTNNEVLFRQQNGTLDFGVPRLVGTTQLLDSATMYPDASIGTWEVVDNCTIIHANAVADGDFQTTDKGLKVTAIADGDVLIRTGWFPVEDTKSYCAYAGFCVSGTASVRYHNVGIEYSDDLGNPLKEEWGLANNLEVNNGNVTNRRGGSYHVASAPIGATQARVLVTLLDLPAGESHRMMWAELWAGMNASYASGVMTFQVYREFDSGLGKSWGPDFSIGPLYLDEVKDVSDKETINFRFLINMTHAESSRSLLLTLRDVNGGESEYLMLSDDFTTIPANTWTVVRSFLNSPVLLRGGGADLTQIDSFIIRYYNVSQTLLLNNPSIDAWSVSIDNLSAGPLPSPASTPRGTVFSFDDIVGSAKAPAAAYLSGASAMTDFLMYSAPPEESDSDLFPSMIPITASAGTIPAPVKLNGVYSVLAGVSPATALATPKLTIVQKQGATTVATKVIDGVQQAGNHYVDFGSVSLPLVPVPDENIDVNYAVSFTPTNASWTELLILNVNGSLVWCSNTTAVQNVWIDSPNIATGIGMVWGGASDGRVDASSLMDKTIMSGGPLQVKAPLSKVLCYSTTSNPSLALSYHPHWLTEPTS